MTFTANYASDHMPVGYALSLFQPSTIISILFGYQLFKEKKIRKKAVGAVMYDSRAGVNGHSTEIKAGP
ncbi:MAG: hypothetical protein KIT80_12645 [Chitinophagaceae bacterium]|nr:hypothetical protein [Chitinophagaceae bacterium]MCW5927753.1 hypothetical protein [Chitinophagaceae bacterium]